jgi:hypothetical protein
MRLPPLTPRLAVVGRSRSTTLTAIDRDTLEDISEQLVDADDWRAVTDDTERREGAERQFTAALRWLQSMEPPAWAPPAYQPDAWPFAAARAEALARWAIAIIVTSGALRLLARHATTEEAVSGNRCR